ncbi:MAG: phosphohydrolase [Pseudomonas sp.]
MSANQHPTLCIYHGNCADGFGAAWVVRKALGANIEFHAAGYGQPTPDVAGKHVVIVDFSYPFQALALIGDQAASVLVLDHHKTAQADLVNLPSAGNTYTEFQALSHTERKTGDVAFMGALFDMSRSGAGITWDFFFPGTPRPALINHIEDRDLWSFKLDGTREILAGLFSYPHDFGVWDALFAADTNGLRLDGIAIERKNRKDVADLVASTKRRMMIGGHDVPVANLPFTLASDAGHIMSAGEPFAACYWDTPEGRHFSLRSSDAGEDVSAIAKQYGGGGHRNASGFRVPFGHVLAI